MLALLLFSVCFSLLFAQLFCYGDFIIIINEFKANRSNEVSFEGSEGICGTVLIIRGFFFSLLLKNCSRMLLLFSFLTGDPKVRLLSLEISCFSFLEDSLTGTFDRFELRIKIMKAIAAAPFTGYNLTV